MHSLQAIIVNTIPCRCTDQPKSMENNKICTALKIDSKNIYDCFCNTICLIDKEENKIKLKNIKNL